MKNDDKQYEIVIILKKKEISEDFLVVAWKEEFKGTKKEAEERAKQLQKEWKAEIYEITEIDKSIPEVIIMSRSQITRLINTYGIDEDIAVVSFADTKDDFIEFPKETDVLFVDFYDLTPFSIPVDEYDSILLQAKEIAAFVNNKIKEGKTILCQCDYGISRSAGLAAAIYERWLGKGIEIFSDYRYSPNQFVFNKILHELKQLDM